MATIPVLWFAHEDPISPPSAIQLSPLCCRVVSQEADRTQWTLLDTGYSFLSSRAYPPTPQLVDSATTSEEIVFSSRHLLEPPSHSVCVLSLCPPPSPALLHKSRAQWLDHCTFVQHDLPTLHYVSGWLKSQLTRTLSVWVLACGRTRNVSESSCHFFSHMKS